MNWSENDLKKVTDKGYKVNDCKINEIKVVKPKIVKVSVEKNTIDLFLKQFQQQGLIESYQAEYKFLENRKFRFDWAIPSLMIAVEYEGIMSKKSRHTTITGYSKDIQKYNLAMKNGWRVLRYTALNYLEFEKDLQDLIFSSH